MSLAEAVRTIRTGVTRCLRPAVVLRISGEHAFDLLDAVSPRPLFLRDGQALHTVFLDEGAHPFADVVLVCDDLDYLVVSEGPTAEVLVAWLRDHQPATVQAEIADLSATHTLFGFDGPYAWEFVGRIVGPQVATVPYLSLFFVPEFGGLGLRGGKTGEFGYDLLIPNENVAAFEARLAPAVAEFDVVTVDTEALDLCALESGFFSIRMPGIERLTALELQLTPVELQLQWRMDRRRTFPGRDALERAREQAPPRITWFRGAAGTTIPPGGAEVELEGHVIGRVLHAVWSPMLDAPIGQVLLPRELAHPGLTLICEGVPFRTVSAPLVRNRSIYINGQRHGWASRHVDTFPAIVSELP